ncbi:TRAP transporter large permease [Brevibacterium album]|uniref:TRAP transporter large permease n=1 Tax=Brevibacterium album TaxID=417948 RepID=UPI00146FC7E3|nr:TRAP transporter large permease subunit [Brevibacterium album]
MTCVIGLLSSQTTQTAGIWAVALVLVLIFLSVPIALALAVPSLLAVYVISGTTALQNLLSTSPFNTAASWTYSVIPAFIFMGMLMVESGLTTKLFSASAKWFGWLPGGVGVGTTAAGAGLASVSGSTIGMTYALARAAIPELLRAGFNRKMAVGVVVVAGIPGSVIPPSILLVVYAGIATVPVGQQLAAGILPGVLIAVTFGLSIIIASLVRPGLANRGVEAEGQSRAAWGERFRSLLPIWGFPLVMIVLFGGLFSGAFTPTEAGAAAAITALLVTVAMNLDRSALGRIVTAAQKTVSATASIFFLIIGAELLMRLLSISGLSEMVVDFIVSLNLSRTWLLLLLVVAYLIMGMFFDTLPMMLLTVPVLLPVLVEMEINLLWFGVFMVIMGEIAMVTPPVGILAFIIHGIAKNPSVNLGQRISLMDVFIAVAWFLPVAIGFVVFLIFMPEVVEWLPRMIG